MCRVTLAQSWGWGTPYSEVGGYRHFRGILRGQGVGEHICLVGSSRWVFVGWGGLNSNVWGQRAVEGIINKGG